MPSTPRWLRIVSVSLAITDAVLARKFRKWLEAAVAGAGSLGAAIVGWCWAFLSLLNWILVGICAYDTVVEIIDKAKTWAKEKTRVSVHA